MTNQITDNSDQSRFELLENGYTAYADYSRDDGILKIKYVYAPEAMRGTGAAGRLMGGIVDIARAENVKILPICGYAVSWLRKHKETANLIA